MAIQYAAELVTVDQAQQAPWRGSARPDSLALTGPCPVCGHDAPNQVSRQVSALERAVPRVETLTIALACTCTENHPGRPAEVSTGCGRHWFAVVAIGADGSVALRPDPAQRDPALTAAAQALRTAGPKQLADIRNAAEKWIGGITALFGLFGLTGVITSRSTLTGLAVGWQVVIAILAVISVGLAGLAIYRIYRAAYGWPMTYPIHNDSELLAWYNSQQAAPRLAAGYLRDGVQAAGGALVALTVTAGFLLFAPQQDPTVPFVQVTLTGGSQVCGTLLPVTQGATLIRRASDGTAISITARSILAETVVTAC